MMISDHHRVMFVHIYKTGGSSLTRLMSTLVEERYRERDASTSGDGWQETWHYKGGQHWKMSDLRKDPEWAERNLDDYLLITFVRNPYTWLLSVWNNFYQHDDNVSSVAFGKLYPSRSFPEFCRFIDACANGLNRFVWGASTQSSFVADPHTGEQFIGRFEQFEQDILRLSQRLGLAADTVPHEVQDKVRDRSSYLDFYDVESIRIVNQLFEEDFEQFSYEQLATSAHTEGRTTPDIMT